MTAKEVFKKAAGDRWTWLTAFVLGTASALIDLHSATRWPHIFLLFASGLALACWRPEWAWRWALAIAFCLPAWVLLTRYWGPYAVDQFDVFYGIVPATAGVICGVCSRWIMDRMTETRSLDEPGSEYLIALGRCEIVNMRYPNTTRTTAA